MDTLRTPTPAAPTPAAAFPDPIPGLIPFGSLCLFVGPPKIGKTSLYASWVPRLLNGQTICGFPTNRPTDIGILTSDHKWELNQGKWFEAVGLPEVRHYALRNDPTVDWHMMRTSPRTRGLLLERSLDKLNLPPGGLLIIDVATVFITNKLNDYNEVVAGIGILTQILDKRGLTCLGIGHMSKQLSDPKSRYLRPHERISGSGAQVGYCDTMLYLLGPEDTGNRWHTFGWLPTHAPAGTFDFQQNLETGLFEPYTLGADVIPADDPLSLVIEHFPPAPETLNFTEIITRIASACDVEVSRAKQRLAELLLDGRIKRVGRGRYQRAIPQ